MIDIIFAMFIGFILCRIWIIERNLSWISEHLKDNTNLCISTQKFVHDIYESLKENICNNQETK